MIRLDATNATSFLDKDRLQEALERAVDAHGLLLDGTGPGRDFLGWRTMLDRDARSDLARIEEVAAQIRSQADALVCVGIGGSYLGAQAVIEALGTTNDDAMPVYFAGHHLGSRNLLNLLRALEDTSVVVNVISKSGTTLEPAVAFRIIRKWLSERYEDADERIVVTTDPSRGALNAMQANAGFRKFEIPPDVGGRFSVLTPVGLLPIACAGIDVRALLNGAVEAAERMASPDSNVALEYAALRNALYADGYAIEILASFEPRLAGVQAWWQQLYGESEGKEGEGLYPDAVNYTTDLHSLGQYVQDGQRLLMETFLMVENDDAALAVPETKDDQDGLNYLAGRTLHEINRKAYEGTAEAHRDGHVPNLTVWCENLAPVDLGELIYFFEHAVAVSGYQLGINPFDQPGVEAYKKNMFRLLGRP